MANSFDESATTIGERLPPGPRVVVIGSAAFWHPESSDTCASIGRELAAIDSLLLITGGVGAVGETTGRSFHDSRSALRESADVFHLLPVGYNPWDYGETMFAGSDMSERREVLARVSSIYVAIEGGPGTKHEATVATSNGATIIPVGRSGGYSAELYSTMTRPDTMPEKEWKSLGCDDTGPDDIGVSVKGLVASCLNARGM
jgi:hypothetical protein